MKILILRTISHTKIWEGEQKVCTYDTRAYEIIKQWEPNIEKFKTIDFSFCLGFYSNKYFSYLHPNGRNAYLGTENENKPSILNTFSLDNTNNFIRDNKKEINVEIKLIKKINSFNRDKMNELENILINIKRKELKLFTGYPSLCFSLDKNLVLSLLKKYNVDMESIGNM
ncbi:MAG: hypothetical protein WC358_05815 [Ignavibacteria bacterium]|jgi:hypothetical protein